MKPQEIKMLIVFGVTVIATAVIATPPGPYSVNVLFVPPLVEGRCNFLQFWNPPNMTCAMCFCFTGRLSRCIPQPGCNPNSNSTSTTTPPPNLLATTSIPPDASSGVTPELANVIPSTQASIMNSMTNPTNTENGGTAAPPATNTIETVSTSKPDQIRKSRSPRFGKFDKD